MCKVYQYINEFIKMKDIIFVRNIHAAFLFDIPFMFLVWGHLWLTLANSE